MSRIAIVTDSTAYLPAEMVERYNITVVPLKLNWEGDTYEDGVDLTTDEFYKRLSKSSSLPTTSQPPTQEFVQIYEALAPNCDGIIVLLISAGISGTVASAQAAAAQFKKVHVEVVDSLGTSGALPLIVMAVAKAIEEGKQLIDVKEIAEKVALDTETYFVVDTLKYLHKGGRIGGASRFLGSALSIKPILYLTKEGKIDALERVRTRRKALKRLVELVVNKAAGNPAHVAIIQADSLDKAIKLQEDLKTKVACKDIAIYEISPVIGTHVGPGSIGVSVYTD